MFFCIHGHFYQPPRENAWLEVIQTQQSAAPFHDWNERINYECYAPNRAARILDDHHQITTIHNNYQWISFNFGPTLLSWMQHAAPETYHKILQADHLSTLQQNGNGNAIAQVYNHMIMPLANAQDKKTQIIWGIYDFKYRFGRLPTGMWLAETAVDILTLEALASENILFTILAPSQAKQIAKIQSDDWTNVSEHSIDTTIAYRCDLPSGAHIYIFFYNGKISSEVAFGGLLQSGVQFANKLAAASIPENQGLIQIATDGETYGHHHQYGEMALASCIEILSKEHNGSYLNYTHFLKKFPVESKVRIHENSSWSCYHGIDRWRDDCGCKTKDIQGWNQKYRKPLREALDWLRDQLIILFENEGNKYLTHPWQVRDNYIRVILDRSDENVTKFLQENCKVILNEKTTNDILILLEIQRQCMLMYTSCGWFFDEISGIETIQILQYACRAISLASKFGLDLETDFIQKLSAAPSNIAEMQNGATVYKKEVLPQRITLRQVAEHITVFAMHEHTLHVTWLYNFKIEYYQFKRYRSGENELIFGQAKISSLITLSTFEYCFACLSTSVLDINGYIHEELMDDNTFEMLKQQLKDNIYADDIPEINKLLAQIFNNKPFNFDCLFKDEKRHFLIELTNTKLKKAAGINIDFFNSNYALFQELKNNEIQIPDSIKKTINLVYNEDLILVIENPITFSFDQFKKIILQFEYWDIEVNNKEKIALLLERLLDNLVSSLTSATSPLITSSLIVELINWAVKQNIALNLWKAQNSLYSIRNFLNNTYCDSNEIKQLFKEMHLWYD